MTKKQKNSIKVLNEMIKMASEDKLYAEMFCEILEEGLEKLRIEDSFGTEGQCDPRGDFREGTWSMDNVEKQR